MTRSIAQEHGTSTIVLCQICRTPVADGAVQKIPWLAAFLLGTRFGCVYIHDLPLVRSLKKTFRE